MNTKIFFLATFLIFTAADAVENEVVNVEKDYDHQILCTANNGADDFEVSVKWKKLVMHVPDGRAPVFKSGFQYLIKNLTNEKQWNGDYDNFFTEHSQIEDSLQVLTLSGQFFMYKRLGTISHTTDIAFNKVAGQYLLDSLKLTTKETFTNPKDFCNPPTRLCGSEPWDEPATVLIETKFLTSSCEYTSL